MFFKRPSPLSFEQKSEMEDEIAFNELLKKENYGIENDKIEVIDSQSEQNEQRENEQDKRPIQSNIVDDQDMDFEIDKKNSLFKSPSAQNSQIAAALPSSVLLTTAISSILATSTISLSSTLSEAASTIVGGSSQPGATVRLNESTSPSLASTIILGLLKLVFGHVPYFIFRILSTTLSLTVTLDFWTVLYLFTFTSFVSIVVYRFAFNQYIIFWFNL